MARVTGGRGTNWAVVIIAILLIIAIIILALAFFFPETLNQLIPGLALGQ